jgi:hypothetical protein
MHKFAVVTQSGIMARSQQNKYKKKKKKKPLSKPAIPTNLCHSSSRPMVMKMVN